jgi:hypothetical protein
MLFKNSLLNIDVTNNIMVWMYRDHVSSTDVGCEIECHSSSAEFNVVSMEMKLAFG